MTLYKVKPLFGELRTLYCPARDRFGYNPKAFYPATIFLQKILNADAWTMDNEAINPNENWMNAILDDLIKLNPQQGAGQIALEYLKASNNGTWFPNGLNITVYPFDIVNILQIKDRPHSAGHWGLGGIWGKVQTIQYTDTPPDFSSLPNYLFSYQCDENSLGDTLMAIDDKGYLMRFPRISRDDLWINMDCVELVDQPNVTKSVNIFSDGSLSV